MLLFVFLKIMKLFFYMHFSYLLCTVMDLVRNTRQQALVLMVVDMNWDKNDVLNVNCSLIGMDCGVLAVDDYFVPNLEQKK